MAFEFLTSERLSPVDTAWWRMARPTNLMMITGVMTFAERLDPARVRATVEQRFLRFARFRQRVVDELGTAYWKTDHALDMDWHVRHVALPGMADRAALQDLVGELVGTPLDPQRPLWQFHLVDDYLGGSALVFRIHHCYADGIALIRVLLSMTDASAAGAASVIDPSPRPVDPQAAAVTRALPGHAGASPLKPVLDAVAASSALAGRAFGLLTDPLQATRQALQAGAFASQAAALALMQPDPPTRFKGRLGAAKRVAWSEPLALDVVKAAGKALGCSVNDVLLATTAGALRAHLAECGDAVDGLEIRVLVPVNLRAPDSAEQLGNRFGMVFLPLPLGIADARERLLEVRRRMQALKGSPQAPLVLGLLNLVGMAPDAVEQALLEVLSRNATAVMTDVPGPRQPLWFAGARINEQVFWVPQSGSIGMGVSILSYDGRVQLGLITDALCVPDPQAITDRFAGEFGRLAAQAAGAPAA